MKTAWKNLFCWRIDGAAVAACLALSLAFYFVGVRPLGGRQRRRAQLQTELEVQRARMQQTGRQRTAVENELSSARESLARCPVHLVSGGRINHRIARLTSLATQCGLKVDEIEPGEVQSLSHFDAIPLRLTGTGDFPTCVRLFHLLWRKFPDKGVAFLDLWVDRDQEGAEANLRVDLIWFVAPDSAQAAR